MGEVNEHIEELIVGFLADRITLSERMELNAWMHESDNNRRYFLRRQEIWFSCVDKKEKEEYDASEAFRRFSAVVNVAEKAMRSTNYRSVHFLKYASVIIAFVLISCFAYYQGRKSIGRSLDKITVEAPVGSRTRIELPDHSVVVLNAGSRLSYMPAFGLSGRQVELVGEGYFEVVRNEKLPFSVCSNSVQVEVLGTKFNFKDYPEDENVSVCLYEGKVGLKNQLKPGEMVLFPNEEMVMDKEDGRMVKGKRKSDEAIGWRYGKLIYKDTPLLEVVHSLERNYGVDIYLHTDSLENIRINGQFMQTKTNLEDILKAIMATERIRYKYERDQIILY